MRAYDIIYKKRTGKKLSKEEIHFMIKGYLDNSIPDYQMSAFAMAIFFQGMDFEETLELTFAMVNSGETYDLDGLPFPTVDKHSTGGVGDKISIPLVPIVSSYDAIVPMMSGRGLGHTGGTLDKLESIPGFRVNFTKDGFFELLKKNNAAMIGQSKTIAPADKRLYALRDVTATVDSIPLITASIMSKKIAEGAKNFVFDVKYGSGAFMKNKKDAEKLANYLSEVAKIAGRKSDYILSDMNTPLGNTIGNRLEIIESIEILKGKGPLDVKNLTEILAAKMLVITGVFPSEKEAVEDINKKYETGIFIEQFRKIIKSQEGDPHVIDDYNIMPPAKKQYHYKSKYSGKIIKEDALMLGLAALSSGAGRERKEDDIDHSCGLELMKKTGDHIEKNENILIIHYNDDNKLQNALSYLEKGIIIEK